MKTLSVYIVAQNEEMYLGNALKSVQDIADEIIVVTDINVDRTAEVAKDFGAKVIYVPKTFDIIEKGWSEYENFGIKQCSKEWILKLDADEELVTPDILMKAIENNKSNVLKGLRIELGYDDHSSQSSWYPEVTLKKIGFTGLSRLFINNGKAHYKGFTHPTFYFDGCHHTQWAEAGYSVKHIAYSKPYGLRIRKSRLYSRLLLMTWENLELRDGTNSGWFNNYVPTHLEIIKKRAKDYELFYNIKVPIISGDIDKKSLETIRIFAQRKISMLGNSKAIIQMLTKLGFEFVKDKCDTIICIDKQDDFDKCYTRLNDKGILILMNKPDKTIEQKFYPIATAGPFVYIKRKKNG